MTFQPGAVLSVQSWGTRPESIEVPHYDTRAPGILDWNYPIGKVWIFKGDSIYQLLSITGNQGVNTANWIQLASQTGLVTPAAITAGTSVTASNGNLTANNGNLVLGTAGNKLSIATGANASVGVTSAMVAGAVTIASTAITVNSVILYSRKTLGGTVGNISITAQAAGSVTLTSSSNTETSTFNYLIIN